MWIPRFNLCRNQNKNTIDRFREAMEQGLDPNKNLANATSLNPNHLFAMKALSRMREQADRSDMGFAGGFVTENGYHYTISNLENDDIQKKAVDYLVKLKIKETLEMSDLEKYFKIVQTEDGVQIQIISDAFEDDSFMV